MKDISCADWPFVFLEKVYLILDEFILAGELQETSKKVKVLIIQCGLFYIISSNYYLECLYIYRYNIYPPIFPMYKQGKRLSYVSYTLGFLRHAEYEYYIIGHITEFNNQSAVIYSYIFLNIKFLSVSLSTIAGNHRKNGGIGKAGITSGTSVCPRTTFCSDQNSMNYWLCST